jgi:gamma-glutamyltranspeptidase/glutathione hydrolase
MQRSFLILLSYLLITAFSFYNQEFLPEPAGELAQQQEITSAENFMVVSANPLASQAGYDVLKNGGGAIDAAIAVQMVLNVVEPQSSGIGGGGFLLYYDAKTHQTNFYQGRETAPMAINERIFLNEFGTARDFFDVVRGGLSVGTPGLLKMLKATHQEHGLLPWHSLFVPAIKIAQEGFPLSPRLHTVADYAKHISQFPATKKLYLQEDDSVKPIATIIKNPQLAKTLKTIARKGIQPFYEGDIAEDIVDSVQNSPINPGKLSLEDLTNYQVYKGNLLCAYYHKNKICSMPMPSSGGVTILQSLGILENFDLTQLEANSAEAVHIIAEAMRLSFADRNKYAADNKFVHVPIEQMLDKKYLEKRSFMLNIDLAAKAVEAGMLNDKIVPYTPKFEPPSTTHISIIDQNGNAVSMTSSIEYAFGSGLSVGGFMLNNQLTDFSFVPEINGKKVANRAQPGKRPRSSMSPTFVFDENDKLRLVLGSPGGSRIIPYVLTTIIAVLDWNMDLQSAINLPHFAKIGDVLELEENTEITELAEGLTAKGHTVKIRDLNSGLHGILINKNGLVSGVDPRREGRALGE